MNTNLTAGSVKMRRQRLRRMPKPMTLKPVRPNVGLQALYRKRMDAIIEEMHDSVMYWLRAEYRANEPRVAELAADELPAAAMMRAIRNLSKRWLKRFEAAAPKLADWFAKASNERSDTVLRKILRDGGFTVKFTMTPAMKDVMQATIGEQVGLIKSIPQKYLSQVEGAVMRSVTVGRDLGGLTKELQKEYGVTRRRAALIARTQNNMATATMTRVRHLEIGITQALWLHSGGGKEPRPTHVANSGKPYNIAEGWLDPAVGKRIWPGELVNCRCVPRPIVKGFS